MEFLVKAYAWWSANSATVVEILGAVLVVALVIPGEHPDKEIKWLLDKLSKKPKK